MLHIPFHPQLFPLFYFFFRLSLFPYFIYPIVNTSDYIIFVIMVILFYSADILNARDTDTDTPNTDNNEPD